MTEAQLQQSILDLCAYLQLEVFHDQDSRRNNPGFPDLVIVGRRTIFAELKSEKGKVRPDQTRWLDRLRESGQEVYLWRPADWEEIVACLKSLR